MPNKLLWIILLGVVLIYINSKHLEKLDNTIQASLTFSNQINDDLSLKRTSPRWKYPYSNYNATKLSNGEFEFPFSAIPVISFEVDPEGLFSYTRGIYVAGIEALKSRSNEIKWWQFPANYRNRGSEWERKAEMSFIGFETNIPSQKIGIRINGNATRAFPQKSLRLVFEKNGIKNEIFENQTNIFYKTMILRNGGNDWDRAFMRDVLISKLSMGLNVETQDAKAVNVYINGEYWGIHYLRPKIDDDYLSGKYNLNSEYISVIESPMKIYRGDSTGFTEFIALLKFVISNDLRDSLNYSIVESQLDIESFIDYLNIEIFIANTDWPKNNWMVWKDLSGSVNNGRWKWILKDADYGLGFYSNAAATEDMIKKVQKSNGAIGQLFNNLIQNEFFKTEFHSRYRELMLNNWDESIYNETVDSIRLVLSPSMHHHIKRWRTHSSVMDWENEISNIKRFYKDRESYLNENAFAN